MRMKNRANADQRALSQREINPVVAGIVITAVVVAAGFFLYMRTGGFGPEVRTPQENPMPKEAGEMLAQWMQRGAERERQKAEQQAQQQQSGKKPADPGAPNR